MPQWLILTAEIAGVISAAMLIFSAGWQASKSKNGYVKASEYKEFQREVRHATEMLHEKINSAMREVSNLIGQLRVMRDKIY